MSTDPTTAGQATHTPTSPAVAIDVDGITWTYASGPSDPVCMGDQPGTIVEVDVAAGTAAVWRHVTDIELPTRFSEELVGAVWDDPETGAVLGARFVGSSTHSLIGEWDTPCFVVACEPERSFGWVTQVEEDPGARWQLGLEPIEGGTRLCFGLTLGPGPSGITMAIASVPEKEARVIAGRVAQHHANMTRVVEGIKAAAEADAR